MIFYLIGSFKGINSGKGGHHYSLMHIADAISNAKNVAIINVGDFEADALNEWTGKIYYIESSLFKTNRAVKQICQLCTQYNPEALHAFDRTSAYLARCVSSQVKIPWLLTKPGGINPSYRKRFINASAYYPCAAVQTVFHKDDYDWFRKRRYQPKILELIPARVRVNFSKRKGFHDINSFFADSEFKIMRIARFSNLHYLSIYQSINLAKKINHFGIKAKLAVIGTLESEELYQQLSDISGEEIRFFTDEKFTHKASDFLPLADIAIGAGRSFMEGCAAGCVMMAPVKGATYPALVDKENIDYFESFNFSNRVPKNEFVNPDRDIEKYIKDIKYNKKLLSKNMKQEFVKRYDISIGYLKYVNIYNQVKSMQCKDLFLDRIIHGMLMKYIHVRKNMGPLWLESGPKQAL